jgi:YD repeat-containing protein
LPASGQVHFDPGESIKFVWYSALDDDILEDAFETIEMTVTSYTSSTGRVYDFDPVSGSIGDDEERPILDADNLGRVVTETDPLVNDSNYLYDVLGRHVAVTLADPDGVGPLDSPVVQVYYDSAGNVISEINAVAGTTTYEYDELGWLTRVSLSIFG